MNFSKSCMYCNNLVSHDECLTDFSCKVNPTIKLKYAGACFIAEIEDDKNECIIVENCPGFEVEVKE